MAHTKQQPPRRVRELSDELKALNGGGDTLNAAKSRTLVKKIGESQLDLWDVVLELQAVMQRVFNIVLGLAITIIGGVVLWFFTSILPDILSHLQ